MRKGGPTPKPIEVHKQQGTFRDDKHLPDTPKDGTADSKMIQTMPAHLHKDCEPYWYLIVGEMELSRTINNGDLVLIESLCINMYMQKTANEALKTGEMFERLVNAKGAEYVQVNPAVDVVVKTQAMILRICSELGLSPAARSQIGVGKSDKNDPLADQLNKKKNIKI